MRALTRRLKKHSDFVAAAAEFRKPDAARARRLAMGRGFKGDDEESLVTFQLTEMSDRLPPLNLHALSGKFKLDPWQLHVTQLIER